MSRTFIGNGQVHYIGTPIVQPIQLCDGGNAVPLFFDWNTYLNSFVNSSINVEVDIGGLSSRVTLLKRISSVYIDNTNSSVPVYVYCPDTRYSAVAKPNSAGWYPLYTNQLKLWVIAQGFPVSAIGTLPQATIFVSDIFVPPYTDDELGQTLTLYKASAVISRGKTIYNTNFDVPALGDQLQRIKFDFTVATPQTQALFGGPQTSGYVIVTQIYAFVENLISNAGIQQSVDIVALDQNNPSNLLFSLDLGVVSATNPAPTPVLDLRGNYKLDATITWSAGQTLPQGAFSSGQCQIYFSYTINPN